MAPDFLTRRTGIGVRKTDAAVVRDAAGGARVADPRAAEGAIALARLPDIETAKLVERWRWRRRLRWRRCLFLPPFALRFGRDIGVMRPAEEGHESGPGDPTQHIAAGRDGDEGTADGMNVLAVHG
jgi:hypothetical protein